MGSRLLLNNILQDELQTLLMGMHDCQQPKSKPAPQAAALDPRDDEIPL